MGSTINLTKVDGCYSKELIENLDIIGKMLWDPIVSVYKMRNTVLSIIAPAFIKAEAKARFTARLGQCRTKSAIHKLCSDAITHGRYYHPKKVCVK